MKVDPRHLEIISAIVEMGGLTEGAELLGKSQPSVSRTISELEARIGTPIFVPGRRPLQPTELGQRLAEQGGRIRAASGQASQLISSYTSGHAGTVRVAGTPLFMDGVITAMLAEFQKVTPDVRVDQSFGYSEQLIDGLRNATVDFAVCPMREQNLPPDIAFQPILQGRNVVACRKDHPIARQSSFRLADIEAYSWISPPQESPLYADMMQALKSIGVSDYKVSFSGGSLASVVSVLSGSDSLTVLPYSVVFLQRKRGVLTTLPLKIDHPERTLGILTYRDRPLRPAVQRLHDFVAKQFRSLAQLITQQTHSTIWRN